MGSYDNWKLRAPEDEQPSEPEWARCDTCGETYRAEEVCRLAPEWDVCPRCFDEKLAAINDTTDAALRTALDADYAALPPLPVVMRGKD